MHKLKARAVSFVTAILLVFTLLPLLPEGIVTAQAYERKFSFTDEKTGLEWKFTLENGGSGDAHIISVNDTLGRDDDGDVSNDVTQITVPEKVTDNVYGYTHHVTKIECEAEGNVETPTFAKFTKLKRVDLPQTLKTIGKAAFKNHPTLEEIYIQTGVTAILPQAFYGCGKLKAVNIPASVTAIKDYAFDECSSLSKIYIPKSVTEIEDHSFERIANDATIYGYTGTKAEAYAIKWGKIFQPLDAIIDKINYSIPKFSGSITFYTNKGKMVTRTDGISSTLMGSVDKSKDATLTADETPDGMFFDGYKIEYSIYFRDTNDNIPKTAYNETFTQTTEENTFSFHLPDEAYEKMFGCIVLWNSNKSRYSFGGTVTITPVFKKTPRTLTIVNGSATLDPSKGSNQEITAAEGDVVYLYGKKPDDGNYYFTGWTLDGEDITLKDPKSTFTTFTMPARDVTLKCNFRKGMKYGLYVDSVQVTTENAADILGNGAFSFDEDTKTLYINKDYTTDKGTLISCNYSFKDTLTITPQKDVTISAKTHAVRLGGINCIITGEHKLRMNNTSYGIYLEDSDFRIINANVEIETSYQGIGGYSSSSNYLTVSNSNVSVKTEKGEEVSTSAGMYVNGAVCNMNMGLTLTNETITAPENWEEIKKSARSFIKDKSTNKPAKEVVFAPVAHTHNLTKHAAKSGSCLEDGNTTYWECTDCGQFFSDKDGKIPVAKDSWVIERTGHKLTWNSAKNATCTEDGHKGSYDCSVCKKHFNSSDKFTKNETKDWLIPKTGHSFSQSYHTSAKQPTFYDKGNVEYWRCTRCYKYFSDDQGTNQLDENSLEIPVLEPKDLGTLTLDFTKGDFKFKNAAQRDRIYHMFYIVNWGHSTGRYYINQRVRVDGPKSGYKVNVDDEHSTGTDRNYDIVLKDDQSGFSVLESRNLSDTTHTIDLNKDAAEFRAICDYIYQETKTNGCYSKVKFIFPDKHVHTLKRVDRKEPTCTEDGNWVYFICTGCGKAFLDYDGKKPTTVEGQTRKATGHDLTATPYKAATCTAAGNKAYWTCKKCNKVYSDKNGKTETTVAKSIIPAKNHKWGTPTYKWSSDNKSVTATRVCANDKKHTQIETVKATAKTINPTCTKAGKTVYTSAAFKNTAFKMQTKTVDIKATGHSWSKWTTVKKATCTKGGTETRKCSKCGSTETRQTKVLGHKMGDWKTTSFNVDKKTATQKRTCTRGDKTETKTLTNAVVRYAGSNRAETGTLISAGMYKTADTVIIATGFDFHDALAAVPLASAYNAPLLLADRDNLSDKTIAEITRLKAKNVIVVATTSAKDQNGYDAAIKSKVYTQLKTLGVKVTKLDGKTYYETAKKVADALGKKKAAPTSVFITTDKNYADALSASPVAAILGAPILYVDPKAALNSTTKNYLASIKKSVKNVYIVGGVNAVSAKVEKAILNTLGKKSATRFAGDNRYETCVKINNAFAKNLTGKSVCIAKGYNFPDALAGGVFAAKNKAPLFLADKLDANATISKVQSDYLKSKNPSKLYIFGGETAVPTALVKTIAKESV